MAVLQAALFSECFAQIEVRHLLPAKDRNVLCAYRADDTTVWYGGEGGANSRCRLGSSTRKHELLPTDQDIVAITGTSFGVLAQARDNKMYNQTQTPQGSWLRATSYGDDCTLLGVFRDTVYVYRLNAGLMKFAPSMQGEIVEPFVGATLASATLYGEGPEPIAYMLDKRGVVMRWTLSTGLDTMEVMEVDTSRPWDHLLVIGADSCLVGNWEQTWLVTTEGASLFTATGAHVTVPSDTVRAVIILTNGVTHPEVASFAAIVTSTAGASRESLLSLDKRTLQWRFLNNNDSILPAVFTCAPLHPQVQTQGLRSLVPDDQSMGCGRAMYQTSRTISYQYADR